MLLTAVFPLLAVAASVLGQDTEDDCAVRAYVRAADLRQNEISHGARLLALPLYSSR